MRRRSFLRSLLLTAAVPVWPARADGSFVDDHWHDPARGRSLPLRIRWPSAPGPCAVVLFSHGLGGNRAGGAAWGEAWQAAGFAVIHLQHPGSDTEIFRDGMRGLRRGAQSAQYVERVRDAHFVLDELERRQRTDQSLARLRLDAIGFCGHSFGARLTQALAGENLPRATADALAQLRDPRPAAFIAFSPGFSAREGTSERDARARFGSIERPFLCVTGTRDDAMVVGDADNAARRAVYRGLPAGRKAELVLDGADHMTFAGQTELVRSGALGRLLKREPGAAEAQARHHELVARLTTDWWQWRLLGDAKAAARLRSPADLAPGDLWQSG